MTYVMACDYKKVEYLAQKWLWSDNQFGEIQIERCWQDLRKMDLSKGRNIYAKCLSTDLWFTELGYCTYNEINK